LRIARIIVKRLCPENGVVLDPFMGFGTFAIPCLEQGKNFIGFEIRPEIFEIAKKRIESFYPKDKIKDFITNGKGVD
jgi:DNA methylase.